MQLITTAQPSVEPLALDEVKLHCYIDTDATDLLLTAFIIAARKWVENYCGISLITQSQRVTFDYQDKWAGEWTLNRKITLPVSPIQSITTVTTYDQSDNATVFDSVNYRLSGHRLILRDNYSWADELRLYDCMQIDFVSGYGDDADAITTKAPEIMIAMKMLIASWYEQRGSITDDMLAKTSMVMTPVPFGVKALLAPYRNFAIC